ncbi:hypothetical protein OsI_38279 [Oryza sativa Indica Group]|uniref:Uncharacterized protein n=1 Tax=Oryza sativa subsp. indica TaxID=39946 RepID=A2ZKC5_ORYSI|nr:hypothetical protein OsI_38279 [Oryza sativa Indica Group]
MNVVLEKLADMERLDGQQKLWRDNVREMAYDIEDCIDVFMYHLGDGHNKDGLLQKTARKIRKLRVRYQIANKIQELKARVMEVAQRRSRYIGLGEATTSCPKVVEIDPRLPALYEAAKNLVGIDGPREEISRWLTEGQSGPTQQLKVVSIVGFGGLGKTTLANQVYKQVKDKFNCTSFLSVSKNPDVLKLLKNLLLEVQKKEIIIKSSLTPSEFTKFPDDNQKLIDTLREHLANKRYLIVIDDIWSTKIWNIIQCAFVQNNYGSRVIITTRIEDVATKCSFDFHGMVYKMQPLDEVNSRSLFFKRLFASEDGFTEQYRKISEDMLRKCKGVPLAIISIASLLASHGMNVERWEKVQNYLGYELETNPTLEWMRHVLNLSYSDVPHDLRACFLYLGIYPEDSKIFKVDLTRLWIAEGFVEEKAGLDLEEAADSYFNELINRSLIEPNNNRLGEVVSCRVHDLMLDLILSKCQQENFITVATKQSILNDRGFPVRRLCCQLSYENLEMERMEVSQVRSFITFPVRGCSTQPPISKFEHLRVLNLVAYVAPTLLDLSAVSNLFLLRHLRIRGFQVIMPQKIGRLQCLRTLDLLCSLLVTGIPSDVISLSSLRHLAVSGVLQLPNWIGKLVSLKTLFAFDVGKMHFQDTVSVGPGDDEPILTKLDKPKFVLDQKQRDILAKIKALEGVPRAAKRFLCDTSFEKFCSTFLGDYSPGIVYGAQKSLHRLIIRKSIHTVPEWMEQCDKLTMLEIRVKQLRSTGVHVLSNLPCLIDLDLTAEATPEDDIEIYTHRFPKLEKFILACDFLPCLKFCIGAMPQLQTLKLDDRRPAQLEQGCSSSSGAAAAQYGSSPLVGIEHLLKLEEVEVTANSSKVFAYRDAVQRHPRIQDLHNCHV